MGVEVVPMSLATLLLLAAIGWVAVGGAVSLAMGRRGHDALAWLLMGMLFGPFTVLFALEAWREERLRPELVSGRGVRGTGPVDVLVGFDGSPESEAALAAVTDLLGPRLGRLTVATVVPYDAGAEGDRATREALERRRSTLAPLPRLEILHGRPSQALLERALTDGYGLLAVGTTGAGASRALLGSTAVDLARSAPVPVLLVGPEGRGATPGPTRRHEQEVPHGAGLVS
ncbi:MAG TPA: universal stress protein [Acidimicrobiia bacterium]|nr:universal stress protein [Acidimicrobiia bacterium]